MAQMRNPWDLSTDGEGAGMNWFGSEWEPMPSQMPGTPQGGGLPQSPAPQQQQQPFDRIAFRDGLMSKGNMTSDQLREYVSGWEGVKMLDDDKLELPGFWDGDIYRGPENIDAIYDVFGANRPAWTPFGKGHDEYGGGSGSGGSGKGGPGGKGGQGGGFGSLFDPAVMNQLKSLFPDGAFNKDLVKSRTNIARDDLNRFQQSRMASNRDQLASRGLLGDGAEATAQNRVEDQVADRYSNAVQSIYGDESERADSRMMQALQLAAGLTRDEAQLFLDQTLGNRGLDIQRELGLGNLSLGHKRADQDYTLGRGNYDLGRARLDYDIESGDTESLIELLRQMYGGSSAAADGAY